MESMPVSCKPERKDTSLAKIITICLTALLCSAMISYSLIFSASFLSVNTSATTTPPPASAPKSNTVNKYEVLTVDWPKFILLENSTGRLIAGFYNIQKGTFTFDIGKMP